MFETIDDLSVCINKFVRFYRLERKHTGLVKELKLKTPIDAIKYWFEIKPELFFNKTKYFGSVLNQLLSINFPFLK